MFIVKKGNHYSFKMCTTEGCIFILFDVGIKKCNPLDVGLKNIIKYVTTKNSKMQNKGSNPQPTQILTYMYQLNHLATKVFLSQDI